MLKNEYWMLFFLPKPNLEQSQFKEQQNPEGVSEHIFPFWHAESRTWSHWCTDSSGRSWNVMDTGRTHSRSAQDGGGRTSQFENIK